MEMVRILWRMAIALALILAGANLMDPYLSPVRSWAPAAILGAAALGLAVGRRSNHRALRWLMVGLWCAGPVTTVVAQIVFQQRKQTVLQVSAGELGSLGQHFIVGYTDIAEVEALAAKGLIGGIFVTRHNAKGRTIEALADDIARLQRARREAGLPLLMVATDQEGGIVSHLSPMLPALPALAEVAELPPEHRASAAKAYGLTQGRQLAALGITVNFAPVLDLRRAHGFNPLDHNSLIGQRAISDSPWLVGEIGLAYAQGLAQAGVTPTVKHFPGLGRVTTDTHHFRASLDTTRAALEESDWQPFRHVLDDGEAMLMVGHVTLSAIDPDHPASHSRKLIDGLLRRDWGYQGLVVTDDLNMTAVYQHGFCDAVVQGLNAGADLLLVAFDGQQIYRTLACALRARRDGTLDQDQLAASDARLATGRSRRGRFGLASE